MTFISVEAYFSDLFLRCSPAIFSSGYIDAALTAVQCGVVCGCESWSLPLSIEPEAQSILGIFDLSKLNRSHYLALLYFFSLLVVGEVQTSCIR